MRAVIIGNSATAVGAVEAMREHDQCAEIVMISEEPHMIYSRPMLDHYLAGKIARNRLAYRNSDFYAQHNVTPMLSTRVASIDTAGHKVVTARGQEIAYDKLLVCTGGTPIVPPVAGANTGGVCTFTRLDDVDDIMTACESGAVKHAVVVGGGMIGIKATDALVRRGISVSMVELAPRILGAALDETASELMTELLSEAGVDVLTGNTVTDVESTNGRISGVMLRDGRHVDCQLMIFGIGVRPNTEIVRDSDIKVNRGIVVDRFMRTTAPDVYAAGDVAEAYDLVVDMNRTVAIWPNAYRQGAIAGAHMVGAEAEDKGGVAMNAIEVHGVAAIAIGNSNMSGDGYEVLSSLDKQNNRYKRLVIEDDHLVGAILVNNINRAGIYTGLIRHKLDISGIHKELLSDGFGLLSLPDRYRKHIVTGQGIEV